MNIESIKKILEAEILWQGDYLGKEIKAVYSSDLLSDVLTFIKPGSMLLTALTNAQVVRTAEMAEIGAVCFLHGKKPAEEAVKLAQESNIPLLVTGLSMYEACNRLHEAGLAGCDNAK